MRNHFVRLFVQYRQAVPLVHPSEEKRQEEFNISLTLSGSYSNKIKSSKPAMMSSLAWCMVSMISDPPTNSPLINICGNVGQLLHKQKESKH
jgi:hypothetical protein